MANKQDSEENAAETLAGESEPKKGQAEGEPIDATDTTDEDVPTGESADQVPPTVESLTESLMAAQVVAETAKDQALRAAAEMENIRRRAARDVENAHKFGVENFTNQLLPVIDSLEKAADSAQGVEGAQAIAEGVTLSLKLFVDALEKVGVTQLNPIGEPFNPQEHEAMAMVPNPDAEPNSVMEVMAKGYLLNGRLVRAAMVVVTKAPD